MNKNLVIVDYQYDFVALDGLLTCGQPAIDIEPNILGLIDKFKDDNIFVTYDTHYAKDWDEASLTNEAKIFPMHCVFETKGHELFGGLDDKLSTINHEKIYKNSFATEKLVKKILEKNNPNEEILIEFCGVATNVCVFQNILLVYNYLEQNGIEFKLTVHKNAVASFDETLEQQSLDYLTNTLGVKII